MPQYRICSNIQLGVTATAAECSTQLAVLMCKIQDGLGQIGCLNDASNLDSTLILDQLTYQVQELRRKLDGYQHFILNVVYQVVGKAYLGVPAILPSDQTN